MIESLLMVLVGSLMGVGEPPAGSDQPPARVGQIFIVGNKLTGQDLILRRLPLYPGALLVQTNLDDAEANLRCLTLLGIGSSLEVLNNDDEDMEFKDIRVTVYETPLTYLILGGPEIVRSLLWER